MRLVVVGGPGEVEAEVTHEVAPSPELDQLVAADLDVAQAHEAATERGHAGGRGPIVIPVDVLDKDQAREVLSGSDLLSEPSERQCRVIEEAGITAISDPAQVRDCRTPRSAP